MRDKNKTTDTGSLWMIVTELDTAQMFLEIALESASRPRIEKAREIARRAYDTASQLLTNRNPVQPKEVHAAKKLASLKSLLQELGENI